MNKTAVLNKQVNSYITEQAENRSWTSGLQNNHTASYEQVGVSSMLQNNTRSYEQVCVCPKYYITTQQVMNKYVCVLNVIEQPFSKSWTR